MWAMVKSLPLIKISDLFNIDLKVNILNEHLYVYTVLQNIQQPA